jgi:hypothetical protein
MTYEPLFSAMPSEEDLQRLTKIGFRFGDKGTHTSRTIMLEELSLVFKACPPDAKRDSYAEAILDHNCLGKRTAATRKLSFQRLRELYGLDPDILLFRVLRGDWELDDKGRPLLALLTALARDPLLRLTAAPILRMQPGEELGRQPLTDAIRAGVGGRLNDSIVDKVVRNTASSWTQSGHLRGRGRKIRQHVRPTPVVTTYALLLGYILGSRGMGLFESFWAKVLDRPPNELVYQAIDAKRLGLLDLSQAGGVIEVSFVRTLADDERQLIHGTH